MRKQGELFNASLGDEDEEKGHAARLAAAATHYKERGRAEAFHGTYFNNKFYRGMPIGCSHEWSYEDAPFAPGITATNVVWKETKVDTDRWYLDVRGQLAGSPPTPGVYFLHGDQQATRRNTKHNSYSVKLLARAQYLGPEYDAAKRNALLTRLIASTQKAPYPPLVFGQLGTPSQPTILQMFAKRSPAKSTSPPAPKPEPDAQLDCDF